MLVGLKEIHYYYFLLACIAFVNTHGQRFDAFSGSRPLFFDDDDDFGRENVHFFGPPSDRFWRQFWDAFNYRGPLQDNSFSGPLPGPVLRPVERPGVSSRPFFGTDYDYVEERFPVPEYFLPRREGVTPVRQAVTSSGGDDYERYRDYFYRRYGTNFVD